MRKVDHHLHSYVHCYCLLIHQDNAEGLVIIDWDGGHQPYLTLFWGLEKISEKEHLSPAQRVDDGYEDEGSVSLHPLLDSRATDEKESDSKVDEGQRSRAGKRQLDESEKLAEHGLTSGATGTPKRRKKNSQAVGNQLISVSEAPQVRHHQGLGAVLQRLGYVPVTQPIEEIKKRAENLAARRLAPENSTICHLPQALIQEILMKLDSPDIRNALASSYIFLRAGVGPCNCEAFRQNINFFGVIMQPHNACPSVAVPNRVPRHPLQSVGLMLQKFFVLRFKGPQCCKLIDSRGGYLLALWDPRGTRFAVLMPLQTVSMRKLPAVPSESQEQFISAAVVPVQATGFVVIRMSRIATRIVLREFSSSTGSWLQKNVQWLMVPSAVARLWNYPLYASNALYLLDPVRMRALQFSLQNNTFDTIPLPVSLKPPPRHHHLLGATSRGEVCWVELALDHQRINIFVWDGASWMRRWQWPLPQHFHSCRLIGIGERSQQVMVECQGQVVCISIEEGGRTNLEDTVPAGACQCFETDHHLVLDHD